MISFSRSSNRDTASVSAGNDTKPDEGFLTYQEKVRGTNINEQTLLATDYLNHFNEIIMTLEMVADMPELLDEAKEWQPKSYRQHFRDSGVADKELAVEAYDFAPEEYKKPFEETIGQMNRLVANCIKRVEAGLSAGDMEMVRVTAVATSRLLQRLMDHASANIHGSASTMEQSEIDALLDL